MFDGVCVLDVHGMRPGTTSKASAPRPEPLARHEEDSSSESENEIQPEAAAEEAPARRGGRTVILSPMWRRGQMAALQLLRKKALQRLNEGQFLELQLGQIRYCQAFGVRVHLGLLGGLGDGDLQGRPAAA